jgi:hypothetical protein
MHDGTNWIRQQGGVDNAVAATDPQGLFVGGTVTDPLDAFSDGDVSLLHFDTSGRLHVTSSGGSTGLTLTETDDDSVAVGQSVDATLGLPYFSNLDNAGVWERWTGRTDDDALPINDAHPTILNMLYGYDQAATSWKRINAIPDNAVIGVTPVGIMTEGIAVDTAFPTFAGNDAVIDRYSTEGANIATLREQEPYELGTSTSTIASGTTVTLGGVTVNDFFTGTRGRTDLNGFLRYDGSASSVTVLVQVSVDAGVSWSDLDSYQALSGATTVFRDLSVAVGEQIRVRVTNNDGANTTGTTRYGFFFTGN